MYYTSAALLVLSGAHCSPLGSHSIVVADLVPAWGLQPHGEGILAGEWRGFPWSPVCVVRSKGPGSAPLVLCHPVQTCSARCLSTCRRWAWSTHLASADSFVASPLFSHPGLGSLPCLKVLGALVETSRANEPDFAVFVCFQQTYHQTPPPTFSFGERVTHKSLVYLWFLCRYLTHF